ncbi:hypothetical protein OCC_11724 [Thermococcus litoralis DSM 5473]|uniref:Uncharacterized protein n=1 Tax=Thermococcus litoralis (strain ATCC 51850 / DSM 5473 / JCM 8560 / NS-C) TaxID=523849 RepID=H3ZNW2_THELN|nr:hypothetical protein [Thermococcus litoralis]EHR78303.1 hypothetical protein OCC_11724 [Thermococcus litoralis DSM 5473]
MKVEGAWPITPLGVSRIFVILGYSLMIAGLILQVHIGKLVWVGVTLLALSGGRGIEVKEDGLVLKYLFWRVKIPFEEIKEVMLANELREAKLFRYNWKDAGLVVLLFIITLIKAPWREFPLLFLWIFVIYVAYFLYLFVPIYKIWEDFGKIFLGIAVLLPIFSALVGENPVLGVFLGIVFLVFIVFWTRFDYIIVNTVGKDIIVIGCPDGKKAIKMFMGVKNEA